MEKCNPRWVDRLNKTVRPMSLALMVSLLVFGGIGFATVEFLFPGRGAAAADVFVGFFRAMDDNYYTTVQVLFTAFVFAKSGEAVATAVSDAKVDKAKAENVNAEPAG